MKINTLQVLKNLRGEEMKIHFYEIIDGKEVIKAKLMSFREIVTEILDKESPEFKLTAEKKNKAFQIMRKLWDGNEIDLTVDQRAFIKERAEHFYAPMTVGILSEILEDEKEATDKNKK